MRHEFTHIHITHHQLMKKIFTLAVLSCFSFSVFAQEAGGGDMKNLRFGGTLIPSLDWYKPDNLKKFAKNGSVARFGVLIKIGRAHV